MVSVLYAAILAIWMCKLSFNVIKARQKNKVSYADGGIEELQVARAAHSNAVDYIPISLLLLFALEYNGGYLWLVHGLGILLLLARFMHGYGILAGEHQKRVLGMQFTFAVIIILAITNLWYLPYAKLIVIT